MAEKATLRVLISNVSCCSGRMTEWSEGALLPWRKSGCRFKSRRGWFHFFFSFIVFLDFYPLAFYCLFSPLILLASRDFCENLFLVKQFTGQRTASKWITSPRWVDTWARDMVMWNCSVAILFRQLSFDHIVNAIYQDLFTALLIVFPITPPVQSADEYVRTYARSITWQPKEKRLTIFYEYGAPVSNPDRQG